MSDDDCMQLTDSTRSTGSKKLKIYPQSRDQFILDENLCGSCAKTCTEVDSIMCDDCENHYHLCCCGVQKDRHATAQVIIKLLGWSCLKCRLDFRSLL